MCGGGGGGGPTFLSIFTSNNSLSRNGSALRITPLLNSCIGFSLWAVLLLLLSVINTPVRLWNAQGILSAWFYSGKGSPVFTGQTTWLPNSLLGHFHSHWQVYVMPPVGKTWTTNSHEISEIADSFITINAGGLRRVSCITRDTASHVLRGITSYVALRLTWRYVVRVVTYCVVLRRTWGYVMRCIIALCYVVIKALVVRGATSCVVLRCATSYVALRRTLCYVVRSLAYYVWSRLTSKSSIARQLLLE